MIDGLAVFMGVLAAGVWLVYLLAAAYRTIQHRRWPFFVPAWSRRAWQEDPGPRGVIGGLVVILAFIVAFTAVPLLIGAAFLWAGQTLLDALGP